MEEKKKETIVPKEGEMVGDYIVGTVIGEGSYSTVKRGRHKETGEEVALKFIRTPKNTKDEIMLEREIKIAQKLEHPNVVKLIDVINTKGGTSCLVMEYIDGCDLYDLIEHKQYLTEDEAKGLFQQMVEGVNYCHKNSITHRDLKLENILIDQDGNIKIVDFGLANFMEAGKLLSTFCGSPLYAAPEMLNGSKYVGPKVDVWSLGVLLYIIVIGVVPWEGSTVEEQTKNSIQGHYELPCDLSEEFKHLVSSMLNVNPEKRPDLDEVLRHSWLTQKTSSDLSGLCEILDNIRVGAPIEKKSSSSEVVVQIPV